MGLLKKGEMVSWNMLHKTKEFIKNKGIEQFIEAYNQNNQNTTTGIVFGEEIELMIVIKISDKYKLYCGSENIIEKVKDSSIEYGRYMVEISSDEPFYEKNICDVEKNILKRCKNINQVVENEVNILMLPCFPLHSFSRFYDVFNMRDDITLSLHFPDNGICNHKRFQYFTENIRNRRGKKIEGYIKVMKDLYTDLSDINKYIHIDSMGQGMGCCGLQVTIQGHDINQARHLYDMMGIMSPLLLRMTRGVPCANGKLLSTETRWDMIEMSVDCRTDIENGFTDVLSGEDSTYNYNIPIPKSRFSTIDLFISNSKFHLPEYNDINVPIHEISYKKLLKNGLDDKLSRHVASLFIRDPLISYLETDVSKYEDFENIQSSNWRSMRFKLPTCGKRNTNGWKVEVRTMELQATPFENAAYIYFTIFLAQAILKYKLNLYIPISKVDENNKKANLFIRNPSEFTTKLSDDKQLFWYRTNINDIKSPILKKGTIKDIFIGTNEFKGLFFYIKKILQEDYKKDIDTLMPYIKFIEDKINYKYITLSEYIRKFILTHDSYKHDSIVCDTIIDELISKLVDICKNNSVDYLLN